ncbi:hypothetical protein OQA88_1348 [Cercophora sp. LCS_1]
MADETEQVLDIERHLKYWKRCLRSPLPSIYLSNEGNRMALAYFIINSIAILTPPGQQMSLVTREERAQMRQWVLSHQHPDGGFSGTSTLVFPPGQYDEWDFESGCRSLEHSGLANIAATVFALQLLALLTEDSESENAFKGVDRVKTLRWLRRLQRDDGSFGEALRLLPDRGWFIAGGYDMRYCYVATVIRWMLRGDVKEGDAGWVEDIDTQGLAEYILGSQTYDGGFAGSSSEEPHAGYAYCAINALSLLDRPLEDSEASHTSEILHRGIRNMPALEHWLASRQFVYLETKAKDDDGQESDDDDPNFALPQSLADLSLGDSQRYVGFNGRCNKTADTCYFWWVGAALSTLGKEDLITHQPARRFLLEKMQHPIGGFGKTPGAPPDVYHACFGLAILATLAGKGLNRLDSSLAVPVETVRRIEKARKGLSQGSEPKVMAAMAVKIGLKPGAQKPGWLASLAG